jgi:endogenous inhibitor of DNA gyrase (YacG/DUF329 family)
MMGVSTETFGETSRSACKIAALTGFVTGEYDAHTMPSESEGMTVSSPVPSAAGGTPRRGRCPTCGRATLWTGNAQRPFCSFTCRLIDLGVWLDERYVVPGQQADDVR